MRRGIRIELSACASSSTRSLRRSRLLVRLEQRPGLGQPASHVLLPERHEDPHQVGLEGVKAFPGDFLTHLALPFQHDPARIQLDETWVQSQPELSGAKNP